MDQLGLYTSVWVSQTILSEKCKLHNMIFISTSYWKYPLLLLSRFSRVRLCATPKTAAHQAPPSMGFSRQEHEWVAISFCSAWKWKVKVRSLSHVWLFSNPMDSYQAPLSMAFSRQEYWSGSSVFCLLRKYPLPSFIYLSFMPFNTNVILYCNRS